MGGGGGSGELKNGVWVGTRVTARKLRSWLGRAKLAGRLAVLKSHSVHAREILGAAGLADRRKYGVSERSLRYHCKGE